MAKEVSCKYVFCYLFVYFLLSVTDFNYFTFHNMAMTNENEDKTKLEQALVLNNQGHAKYMMVDFDDAIADYTEALALCPTLAVALYNRGTVYYRLGNLEPALQDLKRAVHLDPSNGDYREGLQECQRLIRELTKT